MKDIGEQRLDVVIEGRAVPLRIRRHPRARRLTLRVDAQRGEAIATIPAWLTAEDGVDLARRKGGWLLARLDSLPPRRPFVDGATVPLLGVEYPIRACPAASVRGVAWIADGEIRVKGDAAHLSRRLHDWLRARARAEIRTRVEALAACIDARVGRITLRDTRSRWGSCSANGDLSFCWRLILAPEHVLDYVVAHEVAHLRERNHGDAFWSLVSELHPAPRPARNWLRRHGESLHRIG